MNIDIEKIMDEIRQNIKERGYDKEPISFEEIEIPKPVKSNNEVYHADKFFQELGYLNQNAINTRDVPINSKNPITLFTKKIIRNFTRFLIHPLVDFQNAYNISNYKCMRQIWEYMTEMETYKLKIEILEKELDEIKQNHNV